MKTKKTNYTLSQHTGPTPDCGDRDIFADGERVAHVYLDTDTRTYIVETLGGEPFASGRTLNSAFNNACRELRIAARAAWDAADRKLGSTSP